METEELIDSGILELYVYGVLTEAECKDIAERARLQPEIASEIQSIEKTLIELSGSFSPFLSPENYLRIRRQLGLADVQPVRHQRYSWMGWAASLLLLVGLGYTYTKWANLDNVNDTLQQEKVTMEQHLVEAESKNRKSTEMMGMMRDASMKVVDLPAAAVAGSNAKAYYNMKTKKVYIDAAGLPTPPDSMVYQVWALKLQPLTPTSIGLLDNFTADDMKMFAVDTAPGAEAFGITLEPAGGSKSPTLERLYVMGKV